MACRQGLPPLTPLLLPIKLTTDILRCHRPVVGVCRLLPPVRDDAKAGLHTPVSLLGGESWPHVLEVLGSQLASRRYVTWVRARRNLNLDIQHRQITM